jgi:probable phosphoglycerate mutase
LLAERTFLGRFEQAPGCLNVLDVGRESPPDWIVRAVNIAPSDLVHSVTRLTQMEQYWREYVPGRAARQTSP